MKIKLKSNGQIINPPLRVAQRYIRFGRAIPYEEPIIEEPVKKELKTKKKPKVKKEEIFESQVIEEEADSEEE
jgi:hypothetical protein